MTGNAVAVLSATRKTAERERGFSLISLSEGSTRDNASNTG